MSLIPLGARVIDRFFCAVQAPHQPYRPKIAPRWLCRSHAKHVNFHQNQKLILSGRQCVFLLSLLLIPSMASAATSFTTSLNGGANPLSGTSNPSVGDIVGDFDSDGDTDVLAFASGNTSYSFLQNNGSGTFSTVTGSGNPFDGIGANDIFWSSYSTYIADFDNDGDLDIWDYIGTVDNDGSNVYLENTDGTTYTSSNTGGANPLSAIPDIYLGVIIGDFDTDGDIDILAFDDDTYTSYTFYQNNGAGTFSAVTGANDPFNGIAATNIFYASEETYVADFDNDGDLDIWDYRANAAEDGISIYLENTDGSTYTSSLNGGANPLSAIPDADYGVEVGDFDSDGDVDVLAFGDNTYTSYTFYQNNGSGVFSAVTGSSNPFDGIAASDIFYNANNTYVADFDNDGDVDIWDFISDTPDDGVSIYLEQVGAPPTLSSSIPADNASGVDPSANLVLNFSETVSAGSGNIIIRNYNTNAAVATLDVSGGEVSVSGSQATLNPTSDLADSTHYYIEIEPGALLDSDGATVLNLHPAINHTLYYSEFKDRLDFTTGSSNSVPVIGGTTASQTVNDNSTVSLFSAATISDADGDNVTTSISLDSNAKGVFTSASLSASGFTGSGPYTLASTTPANAQTAIRQLVYDPSDNRVAPGSTETTTFTITVNDGSANGTDNTTTVISTSVNDAPVISSNGGGPTASTTINENSTAVTTVTATDADTSESQTFSISGGADQALFSINSSSGALVFASAPDFESPTDSGTDNIYNVQVTVTDGYSATDLQDLAISVGNINENPVITNDGGGTSANINAAENQTAVTTVTAVDQDSGDTLTYSISGGADQASFTINSSTGVLTFASAPNYETPTDSGANNVYEVEVTVTDSGAGPLTDVQAINVTVTNANEAPVITSNGNGPTASTSINENTTAVTTVTATDVDTSDTLTFSISGGADAALFSINSSTGALVFASAPDYETPADSGANNVYDVQVTVTDNGTGPLSDSQAIAVTVNNLNEAPTISGAPAAAPESNQLFSFIPTASDPDAGTSLTFSISTTPSWASFNASTGELSGTPASGDVGTTTSNIVISVSDGSLNDSLSPFSLTVAQGNQTPVISGSPATSVAGHTAYSFVPMTSDAENDPLTFSITNKPAWASFNTATGELSGTPTNSDTGTTTGIVIRVSDGTTSASLTFDLSVTENLDIDGDGMPNDWELANGLDPNDPNDAASDLDGDGISNLNEYLGTTDPNLDDNPPTLTLPSDITLDAVGLFTPVDVGLATAYDALDGTLTATSDALAYYTPGTHSVTWSARDNAGNVASAVQTVNIIPQVSFSKHQATSEGSSVSFRVILNGEAVAYPVTVPYVIAGTAAVDGSDHNLTDGTAVIASGLETTISFNTVDDGPGEGSEEIVIAMDTPTNAVAGPHSIHTIQLLEANLAPLVSLSAEQSGTQVRSLLTGNGPVTVSSHLIDPNSGDSHSYDWTATDSRLSDIDAAADTYTFTPAALAPGLYTLRLSVSDGSASDQTSLTLNIIAVAPSLSATLDSDGDGIDDAGEGIGDTDNDGITDYLDAIATANVLQEQSALSTSYLIESEPGVRLTLGAIALQVGYGAAGVDLNAIETYGGVPADTSYDFSGGLFDFAIDEIPVAGQSVQVVIAQFAAIAQNPVYRKVISGQWQNFVIDANNSLASAAGEPGYCPPPGDSAYSNGLTPGHWCVQLTIEDGGPNDADGIANHAIEEPGGVAERLSTSVSVTSSGGGGGAVGEAFILLLLLALGLAQLRAFGPRAKG